MGALQLGVRCGLGALQSCGVTLWACATKKWS